MKNTIKVMMALAFCFSLACQAKADSQKSIGVGVGMLSGNATLDSDGTAANPKKATHFSSPTLDVNLLFHRKVMTWGLGYRNRSAKSPLGNLKYNGVELMWGYYSNKDKASRLGWHILGGIGSGSLKGVNPGYLVGTVSNLEIGTGLDWVLRKYPDSSVRRPAADVLSLDVRMDGFGAYTLPKNAAKTAKAQFLDAHGLSTAVTFTHYFAWR